MADSKRRAASSSSPAFIASRPRSFSRNARIAWLRGMRVGAAQVHQLLADPVRLVPLMLLFVQLLQIEQRVLVLRIEPQHLVERFERAIDEAAALEVEAEAQQDVGVLGAGQLRPLQQRLMDLDGARDLAALAIDVAENQMDLERVGVDPRRLAQLLDRDVDLVGDQEVSPST